MANRLLLLVGVAAVFAAGFIWWRTPAATPPSGSSLVPLLTESSPAGFARADTPGAVELPRDLGPHEAYRTEWWYYTGNLATADGRPFGFQFTIFRNALTPPNAAPASDGSAWRTNQVYLAHFTISDIDDGAFYPAERFSRGAAGLAGAQAEPYRVWLEDWSVTAVGPDEVRIQAAGEEAALDLTLRQTRPAVLHGDAGLSQKGPERGNASYYFSFVGLAAEGTVTVQDDLYPVTGHAWHDHEYGTSALAPDAVGWDWFSLQFESGAALMLFEIRRADGSLDPRSAGTFIATNGEQIALTADDWELTVEDTWTSPVSGARYPAAWRLRGERLGLDIRGEPLLVNQELNVSTTYWEGAVAFDGTLAGAPDRAEGYIEMTGYEAPGALRGR